jgi:CDP-glucose 4,6-dehydratase
MYKNFLGKKVLVTGHSGFKGSWLTYTLKNLGAEVYGFSSTIPANQLHAFYALDIQNLIINQNDCIGDVRDVKFTSMIERIKPDFIFHLAAQALVTTSYSDPFLTFSTNTIGILNLLEYLRLTNSTSTVVVVTSDKCYKNLNRKIPYVETDELGGHDPYSASKAAAEILFGSYLQSFKDLCAFGGIASARAGNVFGGGDWSQNRIIPDTIKSIFSDKPISLRMPNATRPWTYVHDVINGYLMLSVALRNDPHKYRGSWNFASGENLSVVELVNNFIKHIGYGQVSFEKNTTSVGESEFLQINPNKANSELHWKCRYSINHSLKTTAEWYKIQKNELNIKDYSFSIFQEYYNL